MKIFLASSILAVLAIAACRKVSPASSTQAAPVAAVVPAAASAATPVATAADQELIVAPQESPSGDIQFKTALDLHQTPQPGAAQLRGGQEALSVEWPASLYVTFQTSKGTAACTAALLGPQVMLTAAHCVPSTGKVSFVYAGHNQPYATACTRHPNYPADPSADFALCSVSPAFAAPAGFRYEGVNSSAMNTLTTRPIILTGYGCVSDIVGAGAMDGKYRIGSNTIDETSTSSPRKRPGSAYYAPSQKNNLFTTDDPGSANLCPGDSGGPAFLRSGGGGATTFANRTIIGVNSRVFYANAAGTMYGSSLISGTGGPDFLNWAQSWATTAKVAACGIAGTLTTCRS